MVIVTLRRVIVTGHTGFLGSHISKYLNEKKYQIVGISRKKNPHLDFNQFNTDINKINKVSIPGVFFGIIHCAGITDIQFCQDNPKECFEANLSGTIKMLEFARKKNCKFIFLSTSHVYGRPQKLPIKEFHEKNPISIYASSKYAAEICCKSYAEQFDMDITILRPFSVYGPGESNHFVIPSIISQLKHGKSIEIGNLHPKRDFIFISDITSAIETVLRKSTGFNVFNIGTEKSVSINHVCKTLIKISGKKNLIRSNKSLLRKYDVENIVSNSSLIKNLGWSPKVSLLDGLKRTFYE